MIGAAVWRARARRRGRGVSPDIPSRSSRRRRGGGSACTSSAIPSAPRRAASAWWSPPPTAVCSPSVRSGRSASLHAPTTRISIFMSPLDVHVNREPGRAARSRRRSTRPGKFRAAFADKASLDNERNAVVLDAGGRRYLMVQIAGALARRIVCDVGPGTGCRARRALRHDHVRLARGLLRAAPTCKTGREAGRPCHAGTTVVAETRVSGRRRIYGRPGAPAPAHSAAPQGRLHPARTCSHRAGCFAGFYSIIATLSHQYWLAAVMILVAQMCDVLDGRIARLTRSTSRFGVAVRLARRPGRVRRRARHPRLHVGAQALGPLGLARGVALRDLRRAPPRALQRADRRRSRSGTSSACRSRPRPT